MKANSINILRRHFLAALLGLICLFGGEINAQLRYRVLFIGNSYTSVNNLPQLVHDVALSTGDTLVFNSYTPGGYQLINHSQDNTCRTMIMGGGWDYVILQGQSQEPVVDNSEFTSGGLALSQLIKEYNPCAVIMTYMTWGRKNGDASTCSDFPVMCTYEGMDSSLRSAYLDITSMINGETSPVSVVWNSLRQNYPAIELYQADESHPSLAGSYAAACCFYTALFKKDPTSITYTGGVSAADVPHILNTVKSLVYDSLSSWNFKRLPLARMNYQIGPGNNEVNFQAINQGIQQTYFWDFGDGDTSSAMTPTHSYSADGSYTVSLTTSNCDLQGLHTSFTDTVIQFCSHTPTVYTILPWMCQYDTLWTQPADAYQWFDYGLPIPETNQFLPDYARYGPSGFSVMSTVNGCSELSVMYTESPEWSGYYFDGMGDPCLGDTVRFAVLHTNGFLSGFENILWFKNDTLLSAMTNEDTLLITSQGKYECKVINPNSHCPLDTTSAILEYHCDASGIDDMDADIFWKIFPNPASEIITVPFTKFTKEESIEIYNAVGSLIKSIPAITAKTKINISDFSNGLYIIRLKNTIQPPLKFLKQ